MPSFGRLAVGPPIVGESEGQERDGDGELSPRQVGSFGQERKLALATVIPLPWGEAYCRTKRRPLGALRLGEVADALAVLVDSR